MVKRLITIFSFLLVAHFAIAGCIYLTPLEAKELGIGVMLTWETALEHDNKEFFVEKSVDGIDFSKIGIVKAAGKSSNKLDYSFVDLAIGDQNAMYRLKQIDHSGEFTYSHTVIVNRKADNNFIVTSINSTIIDSNFSFKLKSLFEGNMNFDILSPDNQNVLSKNFSIALGENEFNLNLEEIKNGDYTLRIKMQEEVEYLNLTKVDRNKMPKIQLATKN